MQAFFAGYLEGRMTTNEMYNFYNNMRVNKIHDSKLGSKKTEFELMENFFKEVNIS